MTFTLGIRRVLPASIVFVLALSGCGNADFDAVKRYKDFLQDAKPSLQAMNRVREQLMRVNSPEDMLLKFRDELLPQVKNLRDLAKKHPDPEVKKLKQIHETLRSVLGNYAESTDNLVKSLNEAKSDEDREAALVSWGGEDEKFGSNMAKLVNDLESYLDKLRKGK